MKTILFDDSRWPLVVIRYAKDTDEAEFEPLFEKLEENIRRAEATGTRTCLIYDSTSGYQASPRIRKRQAEWIKQHAAATRLNCCGIAFVINSALVRGVLTAILWMSDMPAPYTVVGTMIEAQAWSAERFAEHGVSLPPRSSAHG